MLRTHLPRNQRHSGAESEATSVMGKLDPSPIPPWAVTMWESDHDIFVALPMRVGGVPYIMRYPRSEAGLAQALRVLCAQRPTEAPRPSLDAPANYTPPRDQPQVRKSKTQERLHAETTPAQREAAQALLRKLGLVKP